MSEPTTPQVPEAGQTDGREVRRITHVQHEVYVVRCDAGDCDALSDWCDSVLGRDYFFKRRHLASILERRNNWVWSIVVDEQCSGLVILYDGSILHNLYLAPEHRKSGIGSAVLQHFRPRRIRSKTNMLAGDPTEFYLRNGYVVDQPDPDRPHIIDMVLPHGSPPLVTGGVNGAHVNGAAKPSSSSPSANGRAIGVSVGVTSKQAPAAEVATPIPPASPAESPAAAMLADGNHVVLTLEQYNVLATLKKQRERVASYRAKRKAEKLAASSG